MLLNRLGTNTMGKTYNKFENTNPLLLFSLFDYPRPLILRNNRNLPLTLGNKYAKFGLIILALLELFISFPQAKVLMDHHTDTVILNQLYQLVQVSHLKQKRFNSTKSLSTSTKSKLHD